MSETNGDAQETVRSSSKPSGCVKTSNDWMSLFLGSRSGQGLDSPSIYSKIDHGKMYERSYSLRSSYGDYAPAYGSSRYYSSVTSGYLSSSSYGSSSRYQRSVSAYESPYSSRRRYGRYGGREKDGRDEKSSADGHADDDADKDSNNNATREEQGESEQDPEGEPREGSAEGPQKKKKKKKKQKVKPQVTSVMNGNVIRITRKSNNVSSSEEDEDTSGDEDEPDEPEGSSSEPEDLPAPSPAPPPPPPEDPLDVEERMLNAQLALSFTLTMTDEENIRQRLLEIKKSRIKREKAGEVEQVLIDRFERETDRLGETSRAKEEEEKILVARLSAESLGEVEQKDIQVRLQELFRDRKAALEVTQKHMETHYEHILQENSTEITELDGSIRGKQGQIEKLQEEMLSLAVRKELLANGMDKVTHRHQEQVEQLACQRQEIESRMSQYAVLAPPPCARKTARGKMPEEEVKELEQELECPVCMDISRPPIYQCEEGHLICSACKPLLTHCPHCAKSYSNPVIRCRFAEKLSEKYFRMVEEDRQSSVPKERDVVDLLK